jgi:hypothetical protein
MMSTVVHRVVAFMVDTGRMPLMMSVQRLVACYMLSGMAMALASMPASSELARAVRIGIGPAATSAALSLDPAAMGFAKMRFDLFAADVANAVAGCEFENGRIADLGFTIGNTTASGVVFPVMLLLSMVTCTAHDALLLMALVPVSGRQPDDCLGRAAKRWQHF